MKGLKHKLKLFSSWDILKLYPVTLLLSDCRRVTVLYSLTLVHLSACLHDSPRTQPYQPSSISLPPSCHPLAHVCFTVHEKPPRSSPLCTSLWHFKQQSLSSIFPGVSSLLWQSREYSFSPLSATLNRLQTTCLVVFYHSAEVKPAYNDKKTLSERGQAGKWSQLWWGVRNQTWGRWHHRPPNVLCEHRCLPCVKPNSLLQSTPWHHFCHSL